MRDQLGQIIVPVTTERKPVFVSEVILYSLAFDAVHVMDDDIFVTTLIAQIQISIVLIGMVIKPSIEPIVLAK